MTTQHNSPVQATQKVAFKWWLAVVFLTLAALPGSTNDDVIFKDGFENHPPVIVSTPKTSAGLSLLYTYDVDATDSDGDLLLYGLVISPDGMVIDKLSGEISWTPIEVGIVSVEVLVSDGNRGSAVQAWQIEVTEIVDSDQDGLSDEEEIARGTDPEDPDTDDDGLNDGDEVYVHDTVPVDFDTDDDGFGDGTEIIAGTNPLDPGDFPEGPADPEASAPDPDPTITTTIVDSTEFLYTGENPVQTGVDEGTIDPVRAAVVRGRVLDSEGNPLPGATVTVLDHPVFGQTVSRANGMFDLVVNGGGNLTINYSKSSYLSAQRRVDVPGQDWVWAEDVALIPLDTAVTTVDFTQATEEFVVAQGSVINDARGSRQSTLLFPQGIDAELVMPDGSTQSINTLNVRATEYSVGPSGQSAMPAELPLGIGYTYCVELSADEVLPAGAKTVRFSQPVINYLENFLGFPAGAEIPVYYYDQEQGAWLPDQNGNNPYYGDLPRAVVIQILGVSEGLADLDANGNGYANNADYLLENFGITDQERQRIASMYSVGQSLWRVPVRHFSTVDYNWPANYGSDQYPSTSDVKVEQTCGQSCETTAASVIDSQNQALGELIGITGTPYSLNYRSDRTPGRVSSNSLDIPLMGASCPATTCPVGIKLVVEVAGQSFTRSFPPDLNQRYAFTWNGKDAYGRTVIGRQPLSVGLGYEYSAQRCATQGQCISDPTTIDILWSWWRGTVGSIDSRMGGIGGWTVNVNHSYDPTSKLLNLGDGRTIRPEKLDPIIEPYAGNRIAGFSGDGGPATEAQLNYPFGIDSGSDGSLYIAEYHNHRVRKVDPDGIITTVAGNGTQGFGGDGEPAVDAMLDTPTDIAVGADGILYIADQKNHRVRKVTPDGIISTFAGNGNESGTVNEYHYGYPATEGTVQAPTGIAIAPDQTVYVTDTRHLVWKIDTAGMKWRFAGKFNCSGFGDGWPALDACLLRPQGISVSNIGEVFIADTNWRRVRRVGLDGIITTVAGDGTPCSDYPECGDGGPAVAAQIGSRDVAADKEGNIYVADSSISKIRKVSTSGIISTIIGNGESCPDPHLDPSCGDGGPASAAPTAVRHLALRPNGDILISEASSNRIRLIRSPLPGFSATDIVIASQSGSELYVFDAAGRHLQTINTLTGTNIYTFSYDTNGLTTQIEDADGNITTIERDPDGTPTAIIAPFGQHTTLALDANGYLATISNPASEVWQFAYTDGGLLTTATDPNENTSNYTYDELGRLVRTDDAAGGWQTIARTEIVNDYEVSKTSGLGWITTYRVENLPTGEKRLLNTFPNGLQAEALIGSDGSITTSMPDGSSATVRLGPDPRFGMQAPIAESQTLSTPEGLNYTITASRAATLSNPNDPLSLQTQADTHTVNGRAYSSIFDAATRQITYTSPEGRQVVMTMDAKGKIESVATAGFEPVEYSYDAQGRLTGVVQGAGASERAFNFSYDPEGYLSSIADLTTRSLDFQYDAAGRVDNLALPNGAQISHSYDSGGNIVSVTPPERLAHSFTYTPIGFEESYIPPDVGAGSNASTNAYNIDRRLTQVSRPDGASSSLGYNSAGQLATVTMPHGIIAYEYDVLTGNVSKITAPDGGFLSYSYDGLLVTGSALSGTVTGSFSQDFDNDFNITSRSVNGSYTINFTYDQDGLLIQAGDILLTREAGKWFINGTTLDNVTDSSSYNGFGELTHYTAAYNGTDFFELQHTRDQVGRITEKTETISGATNTYGYVYDSAGRLIEANKNENTVATYSYDGNGNRLSYTGSGGPVTGTYDGQDRLVHYGNAGYVYTDNGELLNRTVDSQTTSYDYSVLGNLMAVILPDGTRIDYITDGENRRIGKKIDGVLIQGFLYKDRLNPVAELDSDGNVVARFIYGSQIHVPDYMEKAGQVYRIISDNLGSPRVVIDTASGTVIQRIDYDEFGNVTTDTNPGFQPFGFAGGIYDPDTGLTRFGLRDYDAETGRWTAKDPIRFSGGDTNLYAYVKNNPINLFDPWGIDWNTPEQGGQQIADVAKTWVGTPYAPAGTTYQGRNAVKQVGADCSGSTSKIYAEAGFHYKHEGSRGDWPPKNSNLRAAPGNIPQVGDIGQWKGHVLIYDPNAPGKNNAWGARNPAKPFSAVEFKNYGNGRPVTWYRWYEPDEPPVTLCGAGFCVFSYSQSL